MLQNHQMGLRRACRVHLEHSHQLQVLQPAPTALLGRTLLSVTAPPEPAPVKRADQVNMPLRQEPPTVQPALLGNGQELVRLSAIVAFLGKSPTTAQLRVLEGVLLPMRASQCLTGHMLMDLLPRTMSSNATQQMESFLVTQQRLGMDHMTKPRPNATTKLVANICMTRRRTTMVGASVNP
jgi:hypothetical protein